MSWIFANEHIWDRDFEFSNEALDAAAVLFPSLNFTIEFSPETFVRLWCEAIDEWASDTTDGNRVLELLAPWREAIAEVEEYLNADVEDAEEEKTA